MPKRDVSYYGRKQIARESLCALLCDDTGLQKSASLKMANAISTEQASLDVLLSLVRGEPPSHMPSISLSKGLFLNKEEWLDSSAAMSSVEVQVGANTLRGCLQDAKAWERSRIIALRALLMSATSEPWRFEDILPHLLVGMKSNPAKQLTFCRETAVALAVMYVDALPNGDKFEFAVLQVALANESCKMPVLRRIISRTVDDMSLLVKAGNLLERMLDSDCTTPVYEVLHTAPRNLPLGIFGMTHFCNLNVGCLTAVAPRALSAIEWHISESPNMRLLLFLMCALRLSDITDIHERQKCIKFIQERLEKDSSTGYTGDLADIVIRHPNVFRVSLDAIVTCAFNASMEAEPVYDLLLLANNLLRLQLSVTSAAAANGSLPARSMDVAGFLKFHTLTLYLTHCGLAFENDKRLDPLLASITESLTHDVVADYVHQFAYDPTIVMEESHIWADISDLVGDDLGLGLFVALKRRVQSATDIVWAFNSAQRFYVDVTIDGSFQSTSKIPDLHGTVILQRDEWCIRDALKMSLAILTGNVTLHASAISYISSISSRNNERSLFFVSALVESTLLLMRLCITMPKDCIMNMIEMNLEILSQLARHKLALPIVYSAFKYIFEHPIARRGCSMVTGFHLFDARWRCLLLRYSDVPKAKVFNVPTPEAIEAMNATEREAYITVFRSLCKYRPDDAVKHVNDLAPLFYEYPVQAIESCARICKNDVMDFGVAYRVHISPIFQSHMLDRAVVNAVGSFFCDYLQYVNVRIQGPVGDEDLVDLNVILPTLLKLTALNDLNGVTAVAALLKSPLWTKLSTLRRWHLNQECDCNSLLDRIKKRRLQCTYAKLDQEFFEFDFTAFIKVESKDDEGKDVSHSHCQSLLISSVLDAESDETSRVELLSRRNEAVVNFNREIRKATRELLRYISSSSSTVQTFKLFLENAEAETMMGGVRVKTSGTRKPSMVVPMQGVAAGLEGVRWIHMVSLFTLYSARLDALQTNVEAVCADAYNSVVSCEAVITGNFIAGVALLVNLPDSDQSRSLVNHMLLYLRETSDTLDTLRADNGTVNCDKAVIFALALSYMHCRYCVVTEFPLVVLRMLRSARLRQNTCTELADALYLVLGNIYRYTNLHFNMTEDITNLFLEYLEDIHERPLGLGWMLGLTNFIEDLPRPCVNMATVLVNRILVLLSTPEVPSHKRSLLTVPLLQFWGLNRCRDLTMAVSRQLMEAKAKAPTDPCAMLLVAYCHYMDFNLQSEASMSRPTRVYTSSGCTSARYVVTVDGMDRNHSCNGRSNIDGSFGDNVPADLNVEAPAIPCAPEATVSAPRTSNNSSVTDGNEPAKVPHYIQESLKACIRVHSESKKDADMLIIAAMVAHRFTYILPPRTACHKQMLTHKHGWYPLMKDLMDVLRVISIQEKIHVTIMAAPRVSRYNRTHGRAVQSEALPTEESSKTSGDGSINHWGDESAALVAILQLEQIKRFLTEHSDLDCYRENGSITHMMDVLRSHGHSFKLLSALTLCKPLKLSLWDVISFEDTECTCERELVLRIYCLHGQANRLLLKRLASAAKHFVSFDHRLKVSYLNCVRLAFWSIDFNSLRMILSYIADFDDIDVLLAIETLLESCVYLMKGADGAGTNGEAFASEVFSKLLHPVVVQVVSRSKHYKAALCLYRKAMPHLDNEQRRELALAVDTSDIAFKCVLCALCKDGEVPLTFNECFAHLVTQKVSVRDIVLYCYVNLHRHLDVMLHCIHVLNVNTNEQIMLVVLALMALVAERNVSAYLLELAFDGRSIRATSRHELMHVATLDVYEYLRLNHKPNLFYYDTIDTTTLAKSANITAMAPGMWKNCGLEATPLGNLLPMGRGRYIPRWLPKLGNISLDRTRELLLPIALPSRVYESSAKDVMAEHLLVDSTLVIMSAYKAYLVEHHLPHTGVRDVITFINMRIM